MSGKWTSNIIVTGCNLRVTDARTGVTRSGKRSGTIALSACSISAKGVKISVMGVTSE